MPQERTFFQVLETLKLKVRGLLETSNLIVTDTSVFKELSLSDTVWDDIRVPALSTKKGGSKEPGLVKFLDNGAGSQGILTYQFDDSAEEELYFAVQIPHAWKQGTNLHPHVHWSPTVNGGVGEVVSWGLEYSFAEITNVFPDSVLMYGNEPIHSGDLVAKRHYLTELGIIDMTAVDSVSPMILCRIFRDATGSGKTDDYGNDVALLEIDFHFEIDDIGSRTEYTK